MDDTWSLDSVDDRRLELWILMSDTELFKMIQESIYQGTTSSSFSWGWMRIDTSILGYDSEVIIFEYDIERHILSDEFHLFYFPLDLYEIPPIYLFIFIERGTIASYFLFFDHLLEIATRLFWKKSRQVGVDSSRFSGVRKDTKCRYGITIGTTHSYRGLSEKWARVVKYLRSSKKSSDLFFSCLD
jgi:hypothetical protein